MNSKRSNLIDAVRYFSDLRVCNDYMRKIKWNGQKPSCPRCQSSNVGELSTRPILKCYACKKQFGYKVGTIFEDSPMGLDKWFVAVWGIANAKNGISSCKLAWALGITQKTAWFMLYRVREAMRSGGLGKLRGPVESDETSIGGQARNMRKDVRERKIRARGSVDKRIVHGLLQRGGEVRATVVPSVDASELHPIIHRNVEKGAAIFTDEATCYAGLDAHFIHEKAINQAEAYARVLVHMNGLENFWSLFKPCLRETYAHMAPFHLQRYVDEAASRFNARKDNDETRSDAVMDRVTERRLTHLQLRESDGRGFMGLQ